MTRSDPLLRWLLREPLPLLVLASFLGAAIGVWSGLWGGQWAAVDDALRQGPSPQHWLGTNRLGQDLLARLLAGTATAFEIGVSVAFVSVALGAGLGGVAGYYAGRWPDALVSWLAGTIDAVPFYLFAVAIAFALQDRGGAMQLAMILTFWTLTARLVRTQTLRLRQRDYVAAARVSGLGSLAIVRRHILPHTAPILLVQLSIVFVAAIKTEVVLSFLGLGSGESISWGVMIAEASQEILAGHYGNFLAASIALFALVFSVNRLTDRLQDRLDPRSHPSPLKGVA